MNLSDVIKVEERPEPEFTNQDDSAGSSTSGFPPSEFTCISWGIVKKKKQQTKSSLTLVYSKYDCRCGYLEHLTDTDSGSAPHPCTLYIPCIAICDCLIDNYCVLREGWLI